jgi:hypothetical protein
VAWLIGLIAVIVLFAYLLAHLVFHLL